MPLNKQKGNMYNFVSHTWNAIKGKCPHACTYCYCKRWGEQPPLHLDERELKTNLGSGNFIFVGSSCDMWADIIESNWQTQVMRHCEKYPGNTYLFQSKNPWKLRTDFMIAGVYGTTIETNRRYPCMGKAPRIADRIKAMQYIKNHGHRTMLTIEPVLDFDLAELVQLIQQASPEWVNIGADSRGCGLPEPSTSKLRALVDELSKITELKLKPNLDRILKL